MLQLLLYVLEGEHSHLDAGMAEQERDVHAIRFFNGKGGSVQSTVEPGLELVLPEMALTLTKTFLRTSLQVLRIDQELVEKHMGKSAFVSPVVTLEPTRRKMHKAVKLSFPINKFPDRHSSHIKLLVSLNGGENATFDDVTNMTTVKISSSDENHLVSFTSTVTGYYVVVYCKDSIMDVAATMTDLYKDCVKNGNDRPVGEEDSRRLLFLSKSGDVTALKQCLSQAWADINYTNNDGQSALHVAVIAGHIDIVKDLVNFGADLNIFTKRGNNALHLACLHGHNEIVQLLIEKGMSIDLPTKDGYPPIYLATLELHGEVVELLLSKGADPFWVTPDGFSLLFMSLMLGNGPKEKLSQTFYTLVAETKVSSWPMTNRMKQLGFSSHGEAILATLKTRGLDDLKEVFRHHLAQSSAQTFLQEDIGYTETDREDLVKFLGAVREGEIKDVKDLLSNGISVNSASERGATGLHMACLFGQHDILNILLDKGAEVNRQTEGGITPIYLAAQEGYKDIVSKLLKAGADVRLRNKVGLSPADIASEMMHEAVEKIFEDHQKEMEDQQMAKVVSTMFQHHTSSNRNSQIEGVTDSPSKKSTGSRSSRKGSRKGCSLS